MCGIAGFSNPHQDYNRETQKFETILKNMHLSLNHRGPDDEGTYLTKTFGLSHARLSIIDLVSGHQPMTRRAGGYDYSIAYNGEIYNMKELKSDLLSKGWEFETTSDTEIILVGFIEYGPDFVKKLNGIFAFAITDERNKQLFLFRDRSGVKPLFYTRSGDDLIFGSELKALFEYPGVKPRLDMNGLNEIFSIGPAKTYGCGVFKGIDELLPGFFLVYGISGMKLIQYWKLESRVHEDGYEETVEKTSFLVSDAIKRQMVSDVPICTFLSGGVDSSIVSAVCAAELKKQGKQLNTFSFDFVDNSKFFKSNDFQPSRDRPYVEKMVDFLDSNHMYLECDNQSMADCLLDSVNARDLPAMADVDSSMLYFCSQVKNYNKVTLTGECADEIFGGYPWFHKKECFEADTFPWTMDLEPRKVMLSDEFINGLNMEAYVKKTYEKSLAETPRLKEDTPQEARRREIAYLNMKWFMQTLLDRMDRTSMYSGLEARVPFADHRIIEYVFNVPWDMKCKDGVVKSLLRESSRGMLPDEILFRKKSPYPKTYDPSYEKMLGNRLLEVMHDSSSPILEFLDIKKVDKFLGAASDYGKPWYGQLMAGPQMIAYMLQVNYWLKKFNIEIIR